MFLRIKVIIAPRLGLPLPGCMSIRHLTSLTESDEVKRYVAGRAVPATDSDASLRQVSGWLNECLEGHALCRVGISGRKFIDDPTTPTLPDRVIHTGGPTGQPHLLQTAGRRGRYAALSYCWEPLDNGKLPFRLVTGNLAALQEQ